MSGSCSASNGYPCDQSLGFQCKRSDLLHKRSQAEENNRTQKSDGLPRSARANPCTTLGPKHPYPWKVNSPRLSNPGPSRHLLPAHRKGSTVPTCGIPCRVAANPGRLRGGTFPRIDIPGTDRSSCIGHKRYPAVARRESGTGHLRGCLSGPCSKKATRYSLP